MSKQFPVVSINSHISSVQHYRTIFTFMYTHNYSQTERMYIHSVENTRKLLAVGEGWQRGELFNLSRPLERPFFLLFSFLCPPPTLRFRFIPFSRSFFLLTSASASSLYFRPLFLSLFPPLASGQYLLDFCHVASSSEEDSNVFEKNRKR